jgi:iron(III) transport system substrate-binding protein
MHARRRAVLAALAIVSITLAAGCGSSSPKSAGTNGVNYLDLTSSDRQSQLVAEATKEGSVTWYTSLTGDVVPHLQQAFEAAYPGIKVNLYEADGDDVITHVTQEAQAKQSKMDVVELASGDMDVLNATKLLAPFYTPEAANIPAEFNQPGPSKGLVYAAADRLTLISFGYNTDLIDAAHVPTKLTDLEDPYWKGKLAIVSHANGPDWVGAVINQLGASAADQFFAAMQANQMKPEGISANALFGLVAAGTVPASPALANSHAVQQQAKGAHVKWTELAPVAAHPGQVAIGNQAQHPAAAMLFADFLLGNQGGSLLRSDGEASPSTPIDVPVFVPDQGKTPQQYTADEKSWTDTFNKYFGTGGSS